MNNLLILGTSNKYNEKSTHSMLTFLINDNTLLGKLEIPLNLKEKHRDCSNFRLESRQVELKFRQGSL